METEKLTIMEEQKYPYYAFISYSSKDTEWGKRLQRKLEGYRMPATLCSEHGWKRTPIKPVFFAPTDIQPGGLTEELQERLKASRNLIVICSPNSARSEWVGKEIEFFHQLGRIKQIHFFIVDGTPHSGNPDTECFNPIVDKLGLPEILGANIHERTQTYPYTRINWPWMDKQRAYAQLISKLLGVDFDAIWKRHRRLLLQKAIARTVGIFVVLAILICVWMVNQPVNVEVKLNEASIHNDDLPPMKDAIVTMILDNETKTDTVHSIESNLTFTNIPHRYINNNVYVKVECQNFLPTDTTILLSKNVCINILRNPEVFGNVHFRLWNPDTELTSPNTELSIDGHPAKSDENGLVSITIPLEEQKMVYPISSSITLVDETISLPCGPDDVLLFK